MPRKGEPVFFGDVDSTPMFMEANIITLSRPSETDLKAGGGLAEERRAQKGGIRRYCGVNR